MTDALRATIYERDAGVCGICHRSIGADAYQLDHIVPRSKGGTDDPDNLRLAHPTCNNIKHARRDGEFDISAGRVHTPRRNTPHLRLDADNAARLKEVSQAEGLSITWLVNRAIKEYLERREKARGEQ